MKYWKPLLALLLLAAGGAFYWGFHTGRDASVGELVKENRSLREGLARLTEEREIGYARIVEQRADLGGIRSRVRFAQPDPANPGKLIQEKEFWIPGEVVHFDALVIRFSNQLVMDGRERAIHFWRRVYGEDQAPAQGFPLETSGAAPGRYEGLTKDLDEKDRQRFWSSLWELGDHPEKLAADGIQAVQGNAVYRRVRPGFIYTITLSPTGQMTITQTPAL